MHPFDVAQQFSLEVNQHRSLRHKDFMASLPHCQTEKSKGKVRNQFEGKASPISAETEIRGENAKT